MGATDSQATPEALLERYRRHGDVEAVGALFDALAPALYRIALAVARDADRAEDVLQDTFLEALGAVERFQPGRPVKPWLIGILRHVALRGRRREARRPDPARLAVQAGSPRAGAPDAEDRERLRRALDDLDEPYRSVALLHYVHGLAPGEIAHLRDEPPGTVRSTLSRARDRLRGTLSAAPAFLLPGAPPRGLAAIRRTVVSRASAQAAAGTTLTLGGLVMGKSLGTPLAIVLLLLLLGGGTWWALAPGARRDAPVLPAPPAAGASHAATLDTRPGVRPGADASPEVPPAGRVRGTVRDASGKPVAGAHLVAVSEAVRRPRAPADATASARSDAEGRFDLGLDADAPWSVLYAEAPGFAPVAVRGVRGGRRLDLVLREGARLRGHVLDRDDRPVPGARVSVLAIMDTVQVVRRARTDPSGAYEVGGLVHPGPPAPQGPAVEAWILVEAEGFAPLMTNLDLLHPRALEGDHDLYVVRGAVIRGRVTDAESGAALPGAEVVLSSIEGMMGMGWGRKRQSENPFGRRVLAVTHTDRDGTYRFEHVPADSRTPNASHNHDGHGGSALGRVGAILAGHASTSEGVSFMPDGSEREVDLALWPAARLAGRVVDVGGRPLEGVRVGCRSAERPVWPVHVPGAYEDVPSAYATTTADGRFRLEAVPAPAGREAHAHLTLQGPLGPRQRERTAPLDVTIRAGRTSDLGDVVYRPTSPRRVLRVRVLGDGGAPVWDATVGRGGIMRALARTDRDGRAAIGWPAARPRDPPSVPLFAQSPGWALTPFDLKLDESVETVVHLVRGAPLRGRVLDAHGEGVEGAWVESAPADRPLDETFPAGSPIAVYKGGRPVPIEARARTGPDGGFTLDALPPGPHHLRARVRRPLGTGFEMVYLRLGNVEPGTEEVVLRMPPPPEGSRVVVRLLDERGAPISRASLFLEGAQAQWFLYDGRFAFEAVPPGTRTLHVVVPGFVPLWRDVVVRPGDAQPVEVQLSRGVRLEGQLTCVDPTVRWQGLRLSLVRLDVERARWERDTTKLSTDGRFTLVGLHAGRYRVSIRPARYQPGRVIAYALRDNEPLVIAEGVEEARANLRVFPAGVLLALPEDPRLPPDPDDSTKLTAAQRTFSEASALEVRDAAGHLLARAVRLRNHLAPGMRSLALVPGTYTVVLRLPGSDPIRRVVEIHAEKQTELTLRAPR